MKKKTKKLMLTKETVALLTVVEPLLAAIGGSLTCGAAGCTSYEFVPAISLCACETNSHCFDC